MARKLKAYQSSQGFFDLVVAAPSMKAALEAWGANSNLFHQGFAKEADDPKVIAAAIAKPGVVLKRPVGTDAPFREEADLPSIGSLRITRRGPDPKPKNIGNAKSVKNAKNAKRPPAPEIDAKTARKAALAYEKGQRQRDKQRQKEEAAAAKALARQQQAMAAAEDALGQAKRAHDTRVSEIARDRAAVEARADSEEARWSKEKERLEAALRRAGR
jgi:colicin import membrane protein